LIAVLIISFVAASGAATWSFSSRVPANMRITEMGSKLAVREIELVKAKKYINISSGTTTNWYDKNGAYLSTGGSAPSGAVYLATTTVGMPPGFTATGTTKDLLEIVVVVTNTAGTTTYETQRTLLTFGGF
jgi:hypothetical protein